jgi:hypothetical protein
MRLRTIIGALSFGALVVAPSLAEASSHREAPFVSKNPKVDGTDFYAFESYEAGRTGMVTLLANYQPLQDAYGGPNYFSLDPDALYEISVDNDGDGIEDLTFQFQFQNALGGTSSAGASLLIGGADGGHQVAVPFYNVGLIPNATNTGNSNALNVIETYNVGLVRGPRRMSAAMAISNPQGGMVFNKPADNVGAKSFDTTGANPLGMQNPAGGTPIPSSSGYATYANNFIYSNVTIPGCSATGARIFVGQRAEPFAVNLGPTFDLVDAPLSVVSTGGTSYNIVPNPIGKKNITTIALEIPRDCLTVDAAHPVIGAWTTASVRQARVINPAATYASPSHEGGAWTQVSRLGNPLVNEVVIGLPDKDKFNSSEPKDDVTNFATYVEYPTLPAVIDVVFGTDFQPTVFPRTDLVAAFLTGIAPINAFTKVDGGATQIPAEYVHLNTNTEALVNALLMVTVTPTAAGSQFRLGAAGCVVSGVLTPSASSCDPFGFPNGRRPGDDVVDEALDVMEGYLLTSGNPANYALLTDGVDQSACETVPAASTCAAPFLPTFPYLGTPTQGANGDGT